MITAVAPYERLAGHYDEMLGGPVFRLLIRNFEALRHSLGLRFSRAADLGCGTGLFTRYLASRFGVPVIGVDRSPAMLKRASARCAGLPVQLLRQDLRSLALPVPVDLATSNYETLNHLTDPRDLLKVLTRIAAQLLPGGVFISDLLTPAFGRWVGPQGKRFGYKPLSGSKHVMQELRDLPNTGLVSIRSIERDGARRWIESHSARMYPVHSFCDMAHRAGLRLKWMGDAVTLLPCSNAARVLTVLTRT